MNFTPKLTSALGRTLIIATLGSVGWTSNAAPAPTAAKQNTSVAQSLQASGPAPVILAVNSAARNSNYYQPVSAWYKSKHWWKRNAPIVGGAGGGALVGGLIGGGPGVVIGGAAGGGAGYLYKRSRRHRYYNHSYKK
jgi:hypothetical protein